MSIINLVSVVGMDSCFKDPKPSGHIGKIMDDDDEDHPSADSSSSSLVSTETDLFDDDDDDEEATSTSSSSSPSSSSPTNAFQPSTGPLQDMSSLLSQLPLKRGLSRHYNGRSQSFTSLSKAMSLEDLAKPENPYNKKIKYCRSYALLTPDSHHLIPSRRSSTSASPSPSSSSSRLMMLKKGSRGLSSSLGVKRSPGFLGSRPPVHSPHRSASTSSFANQTTLFT